MSATDEIGLCAAKRRLESVETSVQERLERARRLYGVAERKRRAGNPVATREKVAAVRRRLDEAEKQLDANVAHRDVLRDHVRSHPQIEGGIYHGRVQTYDRLRQQVTERKQRAKMELAVTRHRSDRETGTRHRSDRETGTRSRVGDWEDQFDTLRDALSLLAHSRNHDLPVLVREIEDRDVDERRQVLTAGITSRLAAARKDRVRITTIDHETVAREASSVNSELGDEYRVMVDRYRTRYASLEDDLAVVAALVAGEDSRDEVLESLGAENILSSLLDAD